MVEQHQLKGDWKLDEIGKLKMQIGRVEREYLRMTFIPSLIYLRSVISEVKKPSRTELASTNKEWLERREAELYVGQTCLN
jgi:hypothetical protein